MNSGRLSVRGRAPCASVSICISVELRLFSRLPVSLSLPPAVPRGPSFPLRCCSWLSIKTWQICSHNYTFRLLTNQQMIGTDIAEREQARHLGAIWPSVRALRPRRTIFCASSFCAAAAGDVPPHCSPRPWPRRSYRRHSAAGAAAAAAALISSSVKPP
jgi:hypothetical protein